MSGRPPRRVLIRRLIVADVLLLIAAYTAGAWWRGAPIHAYLRSPDRRSQTAGLFRSDPRLGYASVAGASGKFLFPGGTEIPIRFDASGFRIPDTDDSATAESVVALGCSYTFGDAVRAEQTFAAIVAHHWKLRLHNAALSGYGLAQMTLVAGEIIAEQRPRLVLVEYAPWLVDRAIDGTAPSAFGDIPTPYFTSGGEIAPPYFETSLFRLPFWEFAEKDQPKRTAGFLFRASLPYFVSTDTHHAALAVRRVLGRVPASSADRLAVIRDAYARVARTASAVGARMLVFALAGGPSAPPDDVVDAILASGAEFIDAEVFLARAIPGTPTPQAYQQHYTVWAGDPPRLVDPHPNAAANQAIADAINTAIAERRLLDSRP